MREVARGCGLGLELRQIIGGLETFKGKLALIFSRMLVFIIKIFDFALKDPSAGRLIAPPPSRA